MLSCDISNAYLNLLCDDELWTVVGKEFVSLPSTLMQINQAFYGLKSTGNSWHKALSKTLSNMNVEPSRADPYIWLRMSTNSIREEYREWIVGYVKDLLEISEYPKSIMNYFSTYDLKDTVSPPDRYLGANA